MYKMAWHCAVPFLFYKHKVFVHLSKKAVGCGTAPHGLVCIVKHGLSGIGMDVYDQMLYKGRIAGQDRESLFWYIKRD